MTKVLISKQDIAGKELSGAKLTILDEEGNVIEVGLQQKRHII